MSDPHGRQATDAASAPLNTAAPTQARVNPDAVRAWWRSPAAHSETLAVAGQVDDMSVGECLAPLDGDEDDEMTFDAEDVLPRLLPLLVNSASAAGLLGLPADHEIELWNLAATNRDGDLLHDGYLLTMRLPTGLRLAGYEMAAEDLLDHDLPGGVEQAIDVLRNVALTANELLVAHHRDITGLLPQSAAPAPAAALKSSHPAAAAFAYPNLPVPPTAGGTGPLPPTGTTPPGRPRSR